MNSTTDLTDDEPILIQDVDVAGVLDVVTAMAFAVQKSMTNRRAGIFANFFFAHGHSEPNQWTAVCKDAFGDDGYVGSLAQSLREFLNKDEFNQQLTFDDARFFIGIWGRLSAVLHPFLRKVGMRTTATRIKIIAKVLRFCMTSSDFWFTIDREYPHANENLDNVLITVHMMIKYKHVTWKVSRGEAFALQRKAISEPYIPIVDLPDMFCEWIRLMGISGFDTIVGRAEDQKGHEEGFTHQMFTGVPRLTLDTAFNYTKAYSHAAAVSLVSATVLLMDRWDEIALLAFQMFTLFVFVWLVLAMAYNSYCRLRNWWSPLDPKRRWSFPLVSLLAKMWSSLISFMTFTAPPVQYEVVAGKAMRPEDQLIEVVVASGFSPEMLLDQSEVLPISKPPPFAASILVRDEEVNQLRVAGQATYVKVKTRKGTYSFLVTATHVIQAEGFESKSFHVGVLSEGRWKTSPLTGSTVVAMTDQGDVVFLRTLENLNAALGLIPIAVKAPRMGSLASIYSIYDIDDVLTYTRARGLLQPEANHLSTHMPNRLCHTISTDSGASGAALVQMHDSKPVLVAVHSGAFKQKKINTAFAIGFASPDLLTLESPLVGEQMRLEKEALKYFEEDFYLDEISDEYDEYEGPTRSRRKKKTLVLGSPGQEYDLFVPDQGFEYEDAGGGLNSVSPPRGGVMLSNISAQVPPQPAERAAISSPSREKILAEHSNSLSVGELPPSSPSELLRGKEISSEQLQIARDEYLQLKGQLESNTGIMIAMQRELTSLREDLQQKVDSIPIPDSSAEEITQLKLRVKELAEREQQEATRRKNKVKEIRQQHLETEAGLRAQLKDLKSKVTEGNKQLQEAKAKMKKAGPQHAITQNKKTQRQPAYVDPAIIAEAVATALQKSSKGSSDSAPPQGDQSSRN